jgi:sugar/nucleoside kinase (ribokinase family)
VKISFVGHVSKDINVVLGKKSIVPGGGVFFGSIAVTNLGENAMVYTKCSADDRPLFKTMEETGVEVQFLPSPSSTSIENVYPTTNPDDRYSRILSLAAPFEAEELEDLNEEFVHINPLWHGEFPEELIPVIRKKTKFLAGDAQGFLRNIENGQMVYRDWERKKEYLKYFDLFKVDVNEARILTGIDNLKKAVKTIQETGPSMVIATHSAGVCVYDGSKFYEAPFGEWKLEGRTGRGDTCTAAFIVGYAKFDIATATKFAARITTEKMQYPGPYRKT